MRSVRETCRAAGPLPASGYLIEVPSSTRYQRPAPALRRADRVGRGKPGRLLVLSAWRLGRASVSVRVVAAVALCTGSLRDAVRLSLPQRDQVLDLALWTH